MISFIKTKYHNTIQGAQNIIKWFPVIWRDRDWDHNYLMLMIEKKLDSMSKLHDRYSRRENTEEIVRQLKLASKLAGKIASEDYVNEAFGDKLNLRDKNEMVFIPLDVGSGMSKLEFTGLTDDERKELLRLHNLEDELLERDIEILFDLMKNNLRNWWD